MCTAELAGPLKGVKVPARRDARDREGLRQLGHPHRGLTIEQGEDRRTTLVDAKATPPGLKRHKIPLPYAYAMPWHEASYVMGMCSFYFSKGKV